MTSEIENAIQQTERTIRILRRSSCIHWAAKLEQLLGEMRATDRYTQKEALFRVGQLCHPKALGDVFVLAVDSNDWPTQVEILHDSCARAFNTLERDAA